MPTSGAAPVSPARTGWGIEQSSWQGSPDTRDADPVGADLLPSWQPRIEPSPPPRRRGRAVLLVVVGLLVGLLGAGPAGYFVGTNNADSGGPSPTSSTARTPAPSLPVYESAQLAINRQKFSGDLAQIAEPWLAHVANCLRSDEPRGPKLGDQGEELRVYCRFAGVNVYFVQYKSTAEHDRAFLGRQQQNINAQVLCPGVAQTSKKAWTSGKNGNYVEFAYPEKGLGTVSGIWWDLDGSTASAYIETFWKEGLGERWEPLRDVWQRYS